MEFKKKMEMIKHILKGDSTSYKYLLAENNANFSDVFKEINLGINNIARTTYREETTIKKDEQIIIIDNNKKAVLCNEIESDIIDYFKKNVVLNEDEKNIKNYYLNEKNKSFPLSLLKNSILNIYSNESYLKETSSTKVGLGYDEFNNLVIFDLADVVNLLIAGSKGSGKSVCQNVIINQLIYNNSSEDIKFVMFDFKAGLELRPYKDINYLQGDIITDVNEAVQKLIEVKYEIDKRNKIIGDAGFNNIIEYNLNGKKLARLVVVIDELAELVLFADSKTEVNKLLASIAARGRACGVHLILATQKPSREVISPLLDTNITTRIAGIVPKHTDSSVILGETGAENLLGKGDMLLRLEGEKKLIHFQCAFLKIEETKKVMDYLREKSPKINVEVEEAKLEVKIDNFNKLEHVKQYSMLDNRFKEIALHYIKNGECSIDGIKNTFKMGWKRAKRIHNQLIKEGVISEKVDTELHNQIIMNINDFNAKFN